MFQAIKKAEKEVIAFNKVQLGSGENIYGGIVGLYAESTQGYADRDGISNKKPVGEPYYFDWFGDFYKGFSLTVSGDEATLFSTGVGTISIVILSTTFGVSPNLLSCSWGNCRRFFIKPSLYNNKSG